MITSEWVANKHPDEITLLIKETRQLKVVFSVLIITFQIIYNQFMQMREQITEIQQPHVGEIEKSCHKENSEVTSISEEKPFKRVHQ